MTVKRHIHNRENPFVQVARDLVRNRSLSPRARWFLIYFLSFPLNWKMSVPYIAKDQDISRELVYKILNELIDAGYVLREIYLDSGLKRYEYIVSEYPEFKKCLLFLEKPYTAEPEIVPLYKKKDSRDNISPPPLPPPDPIPQSTSSNGGGGFFYRKNKKSSAVCISTQDIYESLSDFKKEIVDKAIESAKKTDAPISDPIKYLASICQRLVDREETPKEKQKQAQEEEMKLLQIKEEIKAKAINLMLKVKEKHKERNDIRFTNQIDFIEYISGLNEFTYFDDGVKCYNFKTHKIKYNDFEEFCKTRILL